MIGTAGVINPLGYFNSNGEDSYIKTITQTFLSYVDKGKESANRSSSSALKKTRGKIQGNIKMKMVDS